MRQIIAPPRTRRRSPGEALAGSVRWYSWSPARRLAFCFFVPWQFALAFMAAVAVGIVVLELAGILH